MTVGLQNLSNQNFYNVRSIVPPLDEQKNIVAFAANETARTEAIVTKALREIELLQEYRTRLIADVVTGKLDVRDAAAQLPDELDNADEESDELLEDTATLDDSGLDAEPEEIEA